MAENSAQHPKVEALYQNIGFIQQCIATGKPPAIAGYLKEFDLINIPTYNDVANPCGKDRSELASTLMSSVAVKISANPDEYFERFIKALKRSDLGDAADKLVQALPEDQRPMDTSKCVICNQCTSLHLMHS